MTKTRPERIGIDAFDSCNWNTAIGFRGNPTAQIAMMADALRAIGCLLLEIRDAVAPEEEP